MGPGTETASSFGGRRTSGGRKWVLRNTDRWHGLFTGDEEKPKWMEQASFFKKRTKTQAEAGA